MINQSSWDTGPRDILADLRAAREYVEANKNQPYNPQWWERLPPSTLAAIIRGVLRENGEEEMLDYFHNGY